MGVCGSDASVGMDGGVKEWAGFFFLFSGERKVYCMGGWNKQIYGLIYGQARGSSRVPVGSTH
jgi:hypothetical protein